MYHYGDLKPQLFTDERQRLLLKVRDQVHNLLKAAGAVRMQEATRGVSGNSWTNMACVDRLVELGELVEISQAHAVPGQYRVFVSAER